MWLQGACSLPKRGHPSCTSGALRCTVVQELNVLLRVLVTAKGAAHKLELSTATLQLAASQLDNLLPQLGAVDLIALLFILSKLQARMAQPVLQRAVQRVADTIEAAKVWSCARHAAACR